MAATSSIDLIPGGRCIVGTRTLALYGRVFTVFAVVPAWPTLLLGPILFRALTMNNIINIIQACLEADNGGSADNGDSGESLSEITKSHQ
jgi:hypothetical protein